MIFMGFEKIQIFAQNAYVLAYDLAKIVSLGHKLIETQYFMVVIPRLWISYT
jgi:hypothetical protein